MARSKREEGAKTSATRNGKNNVLKEKNSGKRILLLTAVFMLTVCSLTLCVSDQSEIQNVTADTPSLLTYNLTPEGNALTVTGFDPLEPNKANLVIPATAMFGTSSTSYPVTEIDTLAFTNETSIITADIGNVEIIGIGAFEGCTNLTTIDVSNVRTICGTAFYGCTGLETLDLSSAYSIGASAFINHSSLETLTIPIFIDIDGIFSGCTLLKDVTLVAGTDSGGEPAVDGYTYPNNAKLPWKISTVNMKVTIGDGVESIGNYMFYNAAKITTLDSGNVKYIYESAFENCTGLTTVDINSAVSLGASAFNGCTNITTLDIRSMITIGKWAVSGLTSLETLTIPICINVHGMFSEYASLSSLTLVAGIGSGGELVTDGYNYSSVPFVPWTTSSAEELSVIIDGSITSIGNRMFQGSANLKTLDLVNVTMIGETVFLNSGLTTIDLSSVVAIGNTAFQDCAELTTIDLSSVVTIGNGAFEGCNGITTLTIPISINASGLFGNTDSSVSDLTLISGTNLAGEPVYGGYNYTYDSQLPWKASIATTLNVTVGDDITSIGVYMFYNCKNIKSIDLKNVTSVGGSAFQGCSALTTAVTGNVTSAGDSAFQGCTALAAIDLSSAVTLGYGAFNGCTGLKEIKIDAQTLINGAFNGCTIIEKVIVTGTGTSIHSGSDFPDSTKLIEVSFPNGANPGTALAGAANIKSVSLSSSVTSIVNGAFNVCTELVTVTATGLTSIGEDAFNGCTKLTTIDLSNVTAFGDSAFNGCTNLGTVNLSKAETIGNSAFSGCSKLKTSDLSKVTSIGGNAFYQCSSLDSKITLNKVTSVGAGAFAECINLPSIDISKATSIGVEAFYGCTSLTTVTAGDITTIGDRAFSDCTNLAAIDVSKVRTIGGNAFLNCGKIKTIDLSSAAEIGIKAFNGLASLETLTIPIFIDIDGIFSGCTLLKDVTLVAGTDFEDEPAVDGNNYSNYAQLPWKISTESMKVTIGDGVEFIGNNTFFDCTKLTTIDMGGVTSIGNGAFSGCTGLVVIDLSKVTYIESNAFNSCTELKEITILASASASVGNSGSFAGCTKINKVTVVGTGKIGWSAGIFSPSTGPIAVTISDADPDAAFSGYKNIGSVSLPSSLTSIAENAFWNCTGLTSINLGNITSIGNNAFNGCTNLGTVDLSKVTSIGDNAFYGCAKLKTSDLSNVTSLGSGAFSGCVELTTIDISKVASVGDNAFYGCEKLTTIGLSNVKSIGNNAFDGCAALKVVDLTNVKTIGDYAFRGLSALETLTIPISINTNGMFTGCTLLSKVIFVTGTDEYDDPIVDGHVYSWAPSTPWSISDSESIEIEIREGIRSIGNYTFQNASGITSVSLSDSVKTIGNYAFNGCTGLTTIDLSNIEMIGGMAFSGCVELTTIDISKATSIGDYAFNGCTELKEITILVSAPVSMYGAAFNECRKIEKVTVVGTGKTAWSASIFSYSEGPIAVTISDADPDAAFSGCTNIGSVSLPSSLTSIANNAFNGSTGLTSINLGNITSIGYNAFNGCDKLTTIDLSNVETIGSNAFYNCAALKTVDLSNVETIGSSAFYNCAALKVVDLSNVKRIENNAFYGLSALETLTVPISLDIAGVFSDCTLLNDVTFIAGTDADGNPTVNGYDYQYYSQLPWKISEADELKVTISDDIVSIGSYMFYYCGNIATIDLRNVTSIGDNAFNSCALKNITLPISATFGNYAFSGVDADKITLTGTVGADHSAQPYAPWGSSKAPFELILEEGIEYIGTYTFYALKLSSVVLPSTLTSIGSNAFARSEMVSLTMPISVETVASDAFRLCDYISEVILTGVDGYDHVKDSQKGLPWYSGRSKTVVISDTVESIGEYMFADLPNNVTIRTYNALQTVNMNAFNNSSGILALPLGVSMNDTTFNGKVLFYSGTDVLGAEAVLTDVDGISGEGKVTMRFFAIGNKTPSSITVTDSVGVEITDTQRERRDWTFSSSGDEMYVVVNDYLDTYTITTETEGNGKIFYSIEGGEMTESTGTIEVESESTVRIFAVPDEYNEFVEWASHIGTFDGNDIVFSSDASGDMGTVKAIFSLIVRDVTYEAGDYVVNVDPEAVYGTPIEFTVSDDDVYVTVRIGASGAYKELTPSSEGIYTIPGSDITDNVHIVVIPTYLFTVPANGSVSYKDVTVSGSSIDIAASGTFRIPQGHKVEITPTTTGFVMLDLDGNILTGKLTIEDVSKDVVLKFIQSVKTETIDGNDVTFEITDLENAVVKTITGETVVICIPSTVTIGSEEYNVTGVVSGAASGSSVQLVLLSEGQTVGNTRGLVYDGPDATISISSGNVTVSVKDLQEGWILTADVRDSYGNELWNDITNENVTFYIQSGSVVTAIVEAILNIRDVTWSSEGGIEVDVSEEASYGTDLEFTVSDANAYVTVTIGSASPYVIEASEGVYTIPGNEIIGDIVITAIPTYLFTVPTNGSVSYMDVTVSGSSVDISASGTFRIPFGHTVQITSTASGYYMLDLDGDILADGILTIDSVSSDVSLKFIQSERIETIDGNDITYEVEDLNNVSITEVSGDGKVLTLPETVTIGGIEYNVSGIVSGALSGSSVELVVLSEGQTVGDAVRIMTYDGPSADVSIDGDTVTVAVNDINGRTLNAEVTDSDGNVIESTVEDGKVIFDLPSGGSADVVTTLTGGNNDGDDGGSSAMLFAAVGAVVAVVALAAVYFLFIRKP